MKAAKTTSSARNWMVGLVVCSLGVVGCGDDKEDVRGPQADAGNEADAGQTDEIPTFNGCAAGDYEDFSDSAEDPVIKIGEGGLIFSPKCMILKVGQTVAFEGSLAAHPLSPGNASDANAGTGDSPIVATSSGTRVTFTFDASGTFPYYCELHSFGSGEGMAGAIHVR